MKKLILLVFTVLLLALSVSAVSFTYVPGIYDEEIEVNHLVADIIYLQIEQSVGNQAYDWVSFIPKSKTIIIQDYDGAENVPIRLNIPKNANIGTYTVKIDAYNQDNKLLKTYDIDLTVTNKRVQGISNFLSKTADFKWFELTYLTIGVILICIGGTIFLLYQLKKWMFG